MDKSTSLILQRRTSKNMGDDKNNDIVEEELKTEEAPKAPVPLDSRLEEAINSRFAEMERLQQEADNIERESNELLRLEEEKKRMAAIETAKRDPVYVLKQLHIVAANSQIVKHLKEIGDILVFEADRGYGKNRIIFSPIDTGIIEKNIRDLYKTLEEIGHSKLSSEDKQKRLKETRRLLDEKETELEETKNAGGGIYLHIEDKDRLQRLDYYSKKAELKNDSVALMRVYFGQNDNYEDLFHNINSTSLIMENILNNINRGKVNDNIEKLKLKIKNSREGK